MLIDINSVERKIAHAAVLFIAYNIGAGEGLSLNTLPYTHSEMKRRDSSIAGAFATGLKCCDTPAVNYDGRHCDVLNDPAVSEHDRSLVRATSDYEVNEVFTRRADGTGTLPPSNGELAVTSSGTRICIINMLMNATPDIVPDIVNSVRLLRTKGSNASLSIFIPIVGL